MSHPARTLFVSLNIAFGASIGAVASLLMLQEQAWAGRPSPQLLGAGAIVAFGAAYVATVTWRGQRVTLRGVVATAGGAAAVVAASVLAVSAPGWLAVWVSAAAAGLLAGLAMPLPARDRR